MLNTFFDYSIYIFIFIYINLNQYIRQFLKGR